MTAPVSASRIVPLRNHKPMRTLFRESMYAKTMRALGSSAAFMALLGTFDASLVVFLVTRVAFR